MAKKIPGKFPREKTAKIDHMPGEYVDLLYRVLEYKAKTEGKSIQEVLSDIIRKEAVEIYGPSEVRRTIGSYHTSRDFFESVYSKDDQSPKL